MNYPKVSAIFAIHARDNISASLTTEFQESFGAFYDTDLEVTDARLFSKVSRT